jgi:adenosylcobalamin-dependent ribonucleoside-triphosphate reductase
MKIQLKVIKRNDELELFSEGKIVDAIIPSMEESDESVDYKVANDIANEICDENRLYSEMQGTWMTVEQISDKVEDCLMRDGFFHSAKKYIRYRDEHKRIRDEWMPYRKFKHLSNDFLREYAKTPDPFKNQLSKVTFYRTYSRYIPELNRRETWLEMNARVVNYIMNIDPKGNKDKAEELFDYMFNFKTMSSGRIRWIAGTEVIKTNMQSAFNCSYMTLDDAFVLTDIMYLLMLGSGTGIRMQKKDIKKIHPFRKNIEVISRNYEPVPKNERQELTTTKLHNNNILEIIVGDSRQGWVRALKVYLEFLTNYKMSSADNIVDTILFNYNNVRPKGEPLLTMGGQASGFEPLCKLFETMDRVIKNSDGEQLSRKRVKLEPIDFIDISTMIGDAIRVGGVRRSAEIIIIDKDDEKSKNAKTNLYTKVNGEWEINQDLIHRQMSNNSVMYESKPTRAELHDAILTLKTSAEPALINKEAMRNKREGAEGLNPLTL